MATTLDAQAIAPLRQRRQRLSDQLPGIPIALWSGQAAARNFPANRYPFRASSHFLYFGGLSLERAVLVILDGRSILFWDEPTVDDALWHGPEPSRAVLAAQMGLDADYPLAELGVVLGDRRSEVATVAVQSPAARAHQAMILGRSLPEPSQATGADGDLVAAIVAVRSTQDALALSELRRSAAIAVAAHQAGLITTLSVTTEAEVRAAIESEMIACNAHPAYNSIVTIRGEVLHNERYGNELNPGDLLLVDAGAELDSGWASDITRTWPVSGQFSATQRAVYEVVLAAQRAAIAAVQPGVEYCSIHHLGSLVLAEGLVDLGILRGDPAELVDRDAHTLFFPHGIGHLLGLDVHDMEDLGDRAGYAPGRSRSERFGWCFLRLDRPLEAGMVVTIEPGFYQVPGLLNHPARRDRYGDCVNWERLEDFDDVRGIRIEDDVLVTAEGSEVLTAELPTDPDHLCALME
jgi:Xaa-Pro aminopeptidase